MAITADAHVRDVLSRLTPDLRVRALEAIPLVNLGLTLGVWVSRDVV